MIWLADWLVDLGRPDAAEQWRGRYSSALGAARLIKRNGGLVGLVTNGTGQHATTETGPGDIGVVEITNPDGKIDMAGAIRTTIGWAVLSKRGVIVSARAVPVACWAA